ncbi:replication initiation protein [Francisella philomiragia]|uniref:replication initiation protein n=1 Tax=Francisella philomiragia TaxID=28110 RepID=UPI00190508B5|nr:replication initiation protein [Francisella philomiragia]MBK2341740.1 replication initiation protein [Francisella philomiragia]
MNLNKDVSMSNLMATKGRYLLTKEEQNFIYLMISQINKNDKEFTEYQIHISDLENAELTQKQYGRYREFAKSLLSKVITIENDKEILSANWFSSLRYIKGTGIIKAKISDDMRPYLLELKDQFVKAKLPVLLSFKSKYSSRLYMYLKSIHGLATSKIDLPKVIKKILISDLIKHFELPKSYRQVYSKFKNNFLLNSLQEINEKTDLHIDYKELKTGRKITSIEFCISKKEQTQEQLIQEILTTQTKSDFIPANASKCVIDVLLDDELGFTKNDIKKLFDYYKLEEIEKVCLELFNSWDSTTITTPKISFFRGKLKKYKEEKKKNYELPFGFDEV